MIIGQRPGAEEIDREGSLARPAGEIWIETPLRFSALSAVKFSSRG